MTRMHKISPDGESTEKWAINTPGFAGSVKQLTHCARCGELPTPKPHNEKRHFASALSGAFHQICDGCYDQLPE